jgi:NAD(P)-dependent dehydrogenase (short-subunit alcohol dehydrogenase family)
MTSEQIYFELVPAVRAMFSGEYPNITNFTEKDSLKFFPGAVKDYLEWQKDHDQITSLYLEETGDTTRILNEIRSFSQTLTKAQKSMPVWIFVKDQGLIHLLGLPDISVNDQNGQVIGNSWNSILGRLAFKVVMVTGGAQGFGAGIAASAFEQGAHVVIVDMNRKKGEELVEKINSGDHPNRMIFVKADISDAESVKNMMLETVKAFGGLDVMISNAGVLRAGGLDELNEADFDFVTKVNYKGFYICTKYASRIMKVQNQENRQAFSDIIQINSKSGLQGSNRNFAYAGSKFGGIGLMQSFALELIDDRIKVNAICPGNFFDGPLWSDPENGLFVQYLRAGKVEGAKNIADVKSFYEAKVPMRRGVTVADVMRAVYYAIEQKYETGQTIPVTGGQVMK